MTKKKSKTDSSAFLDFLEKKTDKELQLREREIAIKEREMAMTEKDREYQRQQQAQMLRIMEAFASKVKSD